MSSHRFSLCVCMFGVFLCIHTFFPYKDTSQCGIRPTLKGLILTSSPL